MKRSSVPNAVLLVMDSQSGVIPESMDGGLIAASDSCIAIGTIAEYEHQVEIEIRQLPKDFAVSDTTLQCVYRAQVATPRRILAACSVYLEELVTAKVSGENAFVEIWVNDDKEPDRVVVVVRE